MEEGEIVDQVGTVDPDMKVVPFFGGESYLSNFHVAPMKIDDKEYKTVEHYYCANQLQRKGMDDKAEEVRLAPAPGIAKWLC